MLDLTQLSNTDYIREHLNEVYSLYRLLDKQIELIKELARANGESTNFDGVAINYTESYKYRATNLDKLLEAYPYSKYPEMYSLTVKQEAANIVKEEDLLTRETTNRITIKLEDV